MDTAPSPQATPESPFRAFLIAAMLFALAAIGFFLSVLYQHTAAPSTATSTDTIQPVPEAVSPSADAVPAGSAALHATGTAESLDAGYPVRGSTTTVNVETKRKILETLGTQ